MTEDGNTDTSDNADNTPESGSSLPELEVGTGRKPISRRALFIGGGAVVAAAVIGGGIALSRSNSGSENSDRVSRYGGDLLVGLYLEPRALDPHRQGYWETYRVSRNLFEGLTKEDTSGKTDPTEIQPSLATKWESNDDATVWTFTLRDGVKFGDGSPFNAAALHKNVRRISDQSYQYYDATSAAQLKAWFSTLVKGEPVGDNQYQFTFSQPFLGLPRILAQSMSTLSVGNPAVWESYGNDAFADRPDGTGPYLFVSRKTGDRIVLKRNPNYWGDRPYLDTLTFRIIPNTQTRLAALLNGEVDLISYVQPEDVKSLESQGFQVPEGTGAQIIYFSFQYKNPVIQDSRIRQALIHGFDRERFVKEVYNGYAQPLHTFYPPGNEAYDASLRDFDYDPEKSKQLLTEAGYGDKQLPITLVVDVANQNAGEWLQAEYAKIGINAKVDALDRDSYGARTWGGNPEPGDALSIDEYGGTYAEWLYQGSQSFVTKESTPQVYDAIQKALVNSDESTRIDQWKQAETQLRESALVIPAINITRYYALSPKLRGFVWPATNWYDLTTVWLED